MVAAYKKEENEKSTVGLRFDEGKIRLDLIPAYPMLEIGKLITEGARKYADRNWEKGMPWSKAIGPMERHLLKFKAGENYDVQTKCMHLAAIALNAIFLLEWSMTHPELDDRSPYHRFRINDDNEIVEQITTDAEGHRNATKYDGSYPHDLPPSLVSAMKFRQEPEWEEESTQVEPEEDYEYKIGARQSETKLDKTTETVSTSIANTNEKQARKNASIHGVKGHSILEDVVNRTQNRLMPPEPSSEAPCRCHDKAMLEKAVESVTRKKK